jgi:hypothetical protein
MRRDLSESGFHRYYSRILAKRGTAAKGVRAIPAWTACSRGVSRSLLPLPVP